MPSFLRSLAFLLFVALPLAAYPDDASFPCKKARTHVEQRVCGSPYAKLKQLDRDLAKWYRRALAASSNAAALRDDQRQWLQGLDYCLTTPSVESQEYVCDSIHETKEKAQCVRDFCLVGKYIDRSRFLYALPTEGQPGRYVLSDRWPSGVRESVDFMTPENRALCKFVENNLSALGPLPSALTQKKPFSEASDRERVNWVSIEKSQLLATAIKLETVLRQRWHHTAAVVQSEEFSRRLAERIEAGEANIVLGPAPAMANGQTAMENEKISVVRYQRWADVSKTTKNDTYQQLEFFLVKNDDFSTVQPIGSAEDAFLLNGVLYFDSISERGFDDMWRPLPIPQPELYVYTVRRYDSNVALTTVCHLLYEKQAAR